MGVPRDDEGGKEGVGDVTAWCVEMRKAPDVGAFCYYIGFIST